MVERKTVKGINCMKFSQLNARVRKKRKGKQILRVLPALLFSLPRYITFEIPVRRAESTKRGGSRLVRIQRAIFCLPSPPLVYPLFSLFARLYVRASSVSTRSTARSLDILETRISLPCIECPWKIETNPVFFLFLSLILGKRGSSFFLLFIPSFLPFFFLQNLEQIDNFIDGKDETIGKLLGKRKEE